MLFIHIGTFFDIFFGYKRIKPKNMKKLSNYCFNNTDNETKKCILLGMT